MQLFITGVLILLIGYFVYGKLVERIFAPDDREVPAKKFFDGLDFLVLPDWKNKLIQLLNIAGIGPVIGVIIGIKFGDIVFVIIPVGCIIAGAVHDFVAGMMSMRNKGMNLTGLVKLTAGKKIFVAFAAFMMLALLLVVAVFINIPAQLLDSLIPGNVLFPAIAVIFVYYICATLFPVDKIIGKVYPIFGLMLLIGTCALFVKLMYDGFHDASLLTESAQFKANMFTSAKNMPILPMLFVTIACGILSGFHATQAPIVARTISSEKQARGVFFGMMVLEGFIAMVWAAGALAIYNRFPEMMSSAPVKVLNQITDTFLSKNLSIVVIISVVILAITSGDTALRSLRLSLAECFNVDQKPIGMRLLMVLPLILLVLGLLIWSNLDAKSFNTLWNYFAWSNQVMAAFTFMAGTIYLAALKKPTFITIIPGFFITFVVSAYILWISPAHGGPVGVGLELTEAYIAALLVAIMTFAWALMRGKDMQGKIDG